MKTLGKLIVVAVVIVLALPVLQYRTASPCGMLKKEWVERAKEQAAEAVDHGKKAVGDYGERAEQIAERVGRIVGDVTEDIAEEVAEMRLEKMSTGACVKELWRLKTGAKPAEAG